MANQKGFAHLLSLLLLIGGLLAGVYLVQNKTNFFPKAYRPSLSTPKPGETIYDMPVLVVRYFPVSSPDPAKLDRNIVSEGNIRIIGSDELVEVQSYVGGMTEKIAEMMTRASTYHGYKDSTATPSLNYRILATQDYLTIPPLTAKFDPAKNPDHQKILGDLENNVKENGRDICDWVDNKGVKVVFGWFYEGTGSSFFSLPESNMAVGTDSRAFWNQFRTLGEIKNNYNWGDISNSTITESNGVYWGDYSNSYRVPDLPVCKKTYVVYDFSYAHGIAEALEDVAHQIESVLGDIDPELMDRSNGRFTNPHGMVNNGRVTAPVLADSEYVAQQEARHLSTPVQDKAVKSRAAENNKLGSTGVTVNRCGTVHAPPNVTNGSQYFWESNTKVDSDCEDWRPLGGGEVKQINCDTWYTGYKDVYPWLPREYTCSKYDDRPSGGNGGIQYKIWWMQNLPGKNNNLPYTNGTVMRNWWEFIGDFDAAIKKGWSLTEQPISTPVPSITASPSASPAPFVCTACAADINKSGKVEVMDLAILKLCFGKDPNTPILGGLKICTSADINKDNNIDNYDYACFEKQYSRTCV